jgi:hypothetical protein
MNASFAMQTRFREGRHNARELLMKTRETLSKLPVTVSAAIVQAPFLALIYPLDTFKTRLQIPFGACPR